MACLRTSMVGCGLAVALACGVRTTSDDQTTATGSTGDTGGMVTTTSGNDGGGFTGGTVPPDTGDGGTPGTGTSAEPTCPAAASVQGRFETDFNESEDFLGECTIDAVYGAAMDIATELRLSCEGPPTIPVSLIITTDPLIDMSHLQGKQVTVEYAAELPFWLERWLVIRDDRVTWLAAIEAPEIDPFGGAIPRPGLELSVVDGLCESVASDCADEERLGLEVTAEGDTATVVDGSRATVGPQEVLLDWARANHPPIMCTDLPGRWLSYISVRADE